MSEAIQNKLAKNKKGITNGFLYTAISLSLLMGFLGGVVFTVYSMPDGRGIVQHSGPSPAEHRQHNLTAAQQMVEERPEDSDAWVRLGHAYFDTDQYGNAIAAYTKSLSITPDDPDVMTDLGVMYRRNGQPNEAMEIFSRIIDISPSHEPSRFNKGVVLFFDKGESEAAFRAWSDLLRINPSSVTPNGQPLEEFIIAMKERASSP